jgi:pyrroline-5-carboxylate reductase
MTSPGDAATTSVPGSAPVEVVLIGGGNMGSALLGGMIGSGAFAAAELGVVELVESRRDELAATFPGVRVSAEPVPCRSAILAVKPPDAAAAAAAARDAGATRLLSIAAGVRIETLQSAVGSGVAVVRAMPNTPALVGRGAAAIAGGATAGAADIEWAARILGSVGTVEELAEPLLDAFTGVAGSGPAYLFLVAEALIDSAVAEGLERPVAERVVRQLLVGSALLLDRELDPVRLRAQVTSPGGTTAAGIAVFEERDLRGTVAAAVAAATARSRELA